MQKLSCSYPNTMTCSTFILPRWMVQLNFSLDGASFRDDYFSEIRNVLQHAEHKLLFKQKDGNGTVSIDEPELLEGKLVDYNGNTIGKVQVIE